MANQDIAIPRFYPDLISYLMARGVAQNGNFDIETGTNLIGLQTGTEAEIFDLRPLNKVDFNTSANRADHVLININTQAAYKKTFIAILNHNMLSAKAAVRIGHSDTESEIQTEDFASPTSLQVTEILNIGTVGGDPYVFQPDADGTSIVSFTEVDDQFFGIQFEGGAAGSGSFDASTDLFIGGIMIGEYYDMSVSPDMSVKRSIVYDKVKVQESMGGQRYASSTSFGRTGASDSKSPFSYGASSRAVHGGRLAYDLKFSYLANTDVMPDEYHTFQYTDDNFVSDVWNMTDGNHRPMIFSVDNSSTGDDASSEHIWARFAHNNLDMTQVMHKIWSMNLRVEEEF